MTAPRVGADAQVNALVVCGVLVLARDAPKQRRQRNGRKLHSLGMFVEAQRADQPVELLG